MTDFSEKEIQNLQRLLTSPDVANVHVALEILKSNKTLIAKVWDYLYLSSELHEDYKSKELMKKILEKSDVSSKAFYEEAFTIFSLPPYPIEEKEVEEIIRKYESIEANFDEAFHMNVSFSKEMGRMAVRIANSFNLLETAQKYFKKSFYFYEANGWLHFKYGMFLHEEFAVKKKSKKWAEIAIHHYTRSIDLGYSTYPAYHNSALLYRKPLGEINQAIAFHLKALEHKPNYTSSLYCLGLLHFDLGDYETAKMYLNKNIEVNPVDTQALNFLAWILAKYDQQFDKALEITHKVLQIKSDNPYSLDTLAYIQLKGLNEPLKAEKTYLKALTINPNHASSMAGLGNINRDTHQNFFEAENYYRKALEIKPKNITALIGMADLHFFHLDQKEKAFAFYEKAFEIEPNNAYLTEMMLKSDKK